MSFIDRDTNKKITTYLFVACLPYSQKIYVEATTSMNQESWMNCNVNMLNYFGGSPLTIVCDNCKTAVISHPRCGDIELNRRKEMGYTYSFKNPFSGKLICEDCGSYYGKKKWHSGTIHEKEIIQCKFKFKHKCKTPNLDEEEVKSMFLKAYNEMIESKDLLSTNLIEAVNKALDTSSLDKQIEALSNELKDMNKEFELLVKMNTTTQQDQTIWRKKYAELEDIYKNKDGELNSLVMKKNEIKLKVNKFNIFIETLKKGELITDFDEAIFNFNLDKAIVHKDKSITFKFYSGFETTIKAEE